VLLLETKSFADAETGIVALEALTRAGIIGPLSRLRCTFAIRWSHIQEGGYNQDQNFNRVARFYYKKLLKSHGWASIKKTKNS
jgi:hypothetical protein